MMAGALLSDQMQRSFTVAIGDMLLLAGMQDIMKQLAAAAQTAFEQTAEAFPDVAPICDGIEQYALLPLVPDRSITFTYASCAAGGPGHSSSADAGND